MKQNKTLSKRELNKIDKRKRLLEAAFGLFLEVGIENTSVSDIVKKAGVAKGTFYLYFSDKSDIEQTLVIDETLKIMKSAIKISQEAQCQNFEDAFLVAVDYIIDYMISNEELMRFINKNLSYAIYLLNQQNETHLQIKKIIDYIYEEYKKDVSKSVSKDSGIVVGLSIEFLGAAIYSSLVFEMPTPIHELRPHLHKVIKGIFNAYRE